MGDSLFSDVLPVLAAQVPDQVLNLASANSGAYTTAFQVGLDWSDGDYNGGTDVIDYTVSYAVETPSQSGGRRLSGLVYTVYAENVVE